MLFLTIFQNYAVQINFCCKLLNTFNLPFMVITCMALNLHHVYIDCQCKGREKIWQIICLVTCSNTPPPTFFYCYFTFFWPKGGKSYIDLTLFQIRNFCFLYLPCKGAGRDIRLTTSHLFSRGAGQGCKYYFGFEG